VPNTLSLPKRPGRLVRVPWRPVVTRRGSFSFIYGRKELSTDCNVFPSAAVFYTYGAVHTAALKKILEVAVSEAWGFWASNATNNQSHESPAPDIQSKKARSKLDINSPNRRETHSHTHETLSHRYETHSYTHEVQFQYVVWEGFQLNRNASRLKRKLFLKKQRRSANFKKARCLPFQLKSLPHNILKSHFMCIWVCFICVWERFRCVCQCVSCVCESVSGVCESVSHVYVNGISE